MFSKPAISECILLFSGTGLDHEKNQTFNNYAFSRTNL